MNSPKDYPEDLKKYIKKHFKYEDGKIIRDDRKNSEGSISSDGYLVLKVKKTQIKAHRLVWFLNYGEFPTMTIDHINRNRQDNRIENLRLADYRIQNNNKEFKRNSDTGEFGIYLDRSTKGLKAIYTTRVGGKTKRFRTLEEAKAYRREMKTHEYS